MGPSVKLVSRINDSFSKEKNYTRQKKFTQAPPVVSVTNMRNVLH